MRERYANLFRWAAALCAVVGMVYPRWLPGQQAGYTFKAQAELVLVNVSIGTKTETSFAT